MVSLLGEEAKAEVDTVLKSAVFVRSPRLARLLKYLCAKHFAGESDQIKEYHIAVEVLDRPESFDPAQDAIARVEARLLGVAEDDAVAAAVVTERVLAHELIARARNAAARGACRRETPVTSMLDDGTLVEGIVDLAFEEPDGWTIVDYKTDREIAAAGEERYRRQIALYAAAIARATDRPTSAVLVRI